VPYPARLTLVNTIARDEATIEVEFLPNRVAHGFQLTCIATHDDKTQTRLTRSLDSVPLAGGRRSYVFELPKPPRALHVGLIVDGVSIHSWRWESFASFGASLRLAALEVNHEHETCVRNLHEGSGRAFEQSVALAFHLAGFSPGWYGLTGKEADLVVFPDYGRFALVVECTQGGTDIVKKLKNLAVRTQVLQGRLDGTAVGVLVCQRASDLRTQSVQEEASRDAVALLTPEDCVRMVERATRGASTYEILRSLEERVPRNGPMAAMGQWSRAGSPPR